METGKPGLASAPAHNNLVAAQTEKRMEIQTPLMAVYIPAVPALSGPPYPQPPAAGQDPATLHLAMPPTYSKETFPFVTLHIAGNLQSQRGMSLGAASPASRPKSTGKHVCPHCGRDCMKPSVLEKHLRCHTGERPYPCTTCGISFKTQSNLYKHKRTQAHARLSSESDQSCPGSLDSMSSSRETCTSSMSLDEHNEESGSTENDGTLPAAESTCSDSTAKVFFAKKYGSVSEHDEPIPTDHRTEEPFKNTTLRTDGSPSLNRHIPLQRQEATLFSKQWESSASRGKSQSHESTDSGFSESSDLYTSPLSVLPDHSKDSVIESTKKHLEETTNTQSPPEANQGAQEAKATAREQEQMTLEERISKLISENTAVVEDKQLENVRPRKTVLSKQGSIDLPMPYTYKDSFHFDMRINKTSNVGLQRNRKPGFYSSVPTQQSTTTEHAPLTRSHSLPFSVTLLQPERKNQTFFSQSDYVTLVRRGSSGQINSTGSAIKPVNQQSSTHRPLVRQAAVDCNHATDGLYMNSSVEEASTGSSGCDGDGNEICGEPSNRKFRRRKAQKFAYNKWYMYGGGTFKKLYNAERGGDESAIKSKKGLTNLEQEVVQGLQKRPSDIQKEQVATTGSTINFPSGCAGVCPQDCSTAKPSLVSTLDFNLKTTQVHTSCRSFKNPFRRNLSLSILPLTVNESTRKAKSMSTAGSGGLINEKIHPDSSSQLSESQIPSDRKKQKTDDKIICPVEMETDQIPITHPSPCVTGSAPHSSTTFSHVNIQKNLKHTPLQGALLPCIISAKSPSVNTSTATFAPSTTKTSFLPKYQLKLPNAAEPDSSPSPNVVDKVTVTSALSLSCTVTTPISPLMQSCGDSKKTSATSSTHSQRPLPCTVSTLCQAKSLGVSKNATTSLDVVHRQPADTTITTSSRQEFQAGLCSTSVQPSKYEERSAPVHLPGCIASVVVNFPVTTSITTGNSQPDISPHQPNPPLSHTHLSPTSDQSNTVNRPYASPYTSVVPGQSLQSDQKLSHAQNVFHVHTGDLQICLQIISDEQLALIEPQIERQAGSTFSQRPLMEAPQLFQRNAQSSDTMRSSGEDRNHQQPVCQQDLDRSGSLSPVLERMKPPLLAEVEKAESNLSLTESSNSKHTTTFADSKAPEALGSLQRLHKYGHVNTVTETQNPTTDVMSTETSLEVLMTGRSQTLVEEHALSLKHVEKSFPDRSGLCSQTVLNQHNVSVKSPSFSTANTNSSRRVIENNEHQNKSKNQGATCNLGMTKMKGEITGHKSSQSDSGKTNPTLLVGLEQVSGVTCANKLSGSAPSYSISKCRAGRQLKPQESIYYSDTAECVLSKIHNSTKYLKMGCITESPIDACIPSSEIPESESQNLITSAQKQSKTNSSPQSQVERSKDILTEPTTSQSSTAGNF